MAVSNGQFWMYTNALLIFWIIVFTTAVSNEYKIKHKIALSQTNAEDELKYTRICKNLCNLCDCLGFYCGEECICECNKERKDTECIRKVQTSGQSLNIPFEVLIQGPTANKFVRNALLYEQNQERMLKESSKKRSTITIYKPSKEDLNAQQHSCEKKTAFKDILKSVDNSKKRQKRSSGNTDFDWFSNLGSNLLRPVPLGGRKRQIKETKKPTAKATIDPPLLGNSWLFDTYDNTRNILTPRPLKKRKNLHTSSENQEENLKSGFNYSGELKDTKRNTKKTLLADDTDGKELQENQIVRRLKTKFDKTNDKHLLGPVKKDKETAQESSLNQDGLGENDLFAEEVEDGKRTKEKIQKRKTSDSSKSQSDESTSQKLPPTNTQNVFSTSWFKPGKLLKKFRQAINA